MMMDIKNAVEAFDIHEMSEKAQELGGKVHAWSTRPIVSIPIPWCNPAPRQKFSFCPSLLYWTAGNRNLSRARAFLSRQINLALHVQRFEDDRRARDSFWHTQCSVRTHPHNESVYRLFHYSPTDTKSCVLVLDQSSTFCH